MSMRHWSEEDSVGLAGDVIKVVLWTDKHCLVRVTRYRNPTLISAETRATCVRLCRCNCPSLNAFWCFIYHHSSVLSLRNHARILIPQRGYLSSNSQGQRNMESYFTSIPPCLLLVDIQADDRPATSRPDYVRTTRHTLTVLTGLRLLRPSYGGQSINSIVQQEK